MQARSEQDLHAMWQSTAANNFHYCRHIVAYLRAYHTACNIDGKTLAIMYRQLTVKLK